MTELNRDRRDHALDKLAKLLARIDSQSPPPDWMVDSPAKDALADEVADLIALILLE